MCKAGCSDFDTRFFLFGDFLQINEEVQICCTLMVGCCGPTSASINQTEYKLGPLHFKSKRERGYAPN